MMKVTVLYDKAYGGHHWEFLQRINNYIYQLNDSNSFVFIVHYKYAPNLKKSNKIDVITLTENDLSIIEKPKKNIERSLIEWKILNSKIDLLSIDTIMFMDIDFYQYLLGSQLLIRTSLRVVGILFSPPYRIKLDSLNIANYIKWTRKRIQLFWMLRNKNIKDLFILNDDKCVSSLNATFATSAFRYLPDPINDRPILKKEDLFYDKHNLDKNRKIILCIGSISERKNIINIILSLAYLNDHDKKKYQLLICGKCDDNQLLQDIHRSIKKISEGSSLIKINLIDSILSDTELDEFFSISDIIAIPYINFYTSSGILGHAAKYRKPVLVSDYGLMSEITTKYKLGICVDPHNASSIAVGIEKVSMLNLEMSKATEYCQEHNTAIFCQYIYSRLTY